MIYIQFYLFLQVKKVTCIGVEMIVFQFFDIFNRTAMNYTFLFIMKNCKHETIWEAIVKVTHCTSYKV